MSIDNKTKTPGQPNKCQESSCVGCQFLNQCKQIVVANPENIKKAIEEAQMNSMGSIVYESYDASAFDSR